MKGGCPVVEFDCAMCGWHVYGIGIDAPPDPPHCGTCGWLEQIADPETREAIRRRLTGMPGEAPAQAAGEPDR